MQLRPIDRIPEISGAEFSEQYFRKAKPVVMRNFISGESPAWKTWNYEYFRKISGDTVVALHGKENHSNDKVVSSPVTWMTFGGYLDLIEKEPTDLRIFLFNLMKLNPDMNHDLVYNDPTGGKLLKWIPFLFFGGEGSRTRNHFDIDMSHVFLTQFKGIKKVWLFPPEASDLLYKLPYNFHGIADLRNMDYKKFPALKYVKGYETDIHPGETLFIPSGWWHYIMYVTEGYSVSVRALPSTHAGKWRGARNLLFTRYFDNLMRKLLGKKWFDYKVRKAKNKARRAIRKIRKKQG